MKISKYLLGAGLIAMLWGCSSDAPTMEEPKYPVPADIAENDCYACIGVSLPTISSTRAASPADETLESEYRVINGYILLFKKSADNIEANAQFIARHTLSTNWKEDTDNADISKTSYSAVAFPKGTFEEGADYGAVIVLNAPTGYPFPKAPQKGEDGKMVYTTLGQWATQASDVTFTIKDGNTTYMTMVSAPEYKKTENKVSVLGTLDMTMAVKDMALLSRDKTAGTFHVHRVASKLSFTARGDHDAQKDDHVYDITGGYGATVTIKAWAPSVVAKKCYLLQNTTGLDFSLAHMSTFGDANFKKFTRCSWAKGPNYDTPLTTNTDNDYTVVTSLADQSTLNSFEYVKENTMSAKNQVEKRTTMAVIKAQYTLNNEAPTTTLLRIGKETNLVRTVDDYAALVTTKAQLLWNDKAKVEISKTLTNRNTNFKELVKISYTTGEGDAAVTTVPTDAEYETIAKECQVSSATANEINYYRNGECYYYVLVRHFDDQEVPLGKVINVWSDYEDRHLGRYGMLRNNWYEVVINSINRIGSPVPPTPDDTPDDKIKDDVNGIDFDIKVLNWAKRSQDEDL